jgi:rubrerythrin
MTTTGIDFRTLSLQDALDLAVLIEEEARDRYEEFGDQLELHHTPEAASFFRFMARNEEKHRAELAMRREQRFAGAPARLSRARIFDVEAPDYDEARAWMTARDALLAALRSEEKAHAYFVAALPHVADRAVRELFLELADEELDHQRLVRAELAKLPPEDPLRQDDFADEPVAH